jgi:hypothetical protein
MTQESAAMRGTPGMPRGLLSTSLLLVGRDEAFTLGLGEPEFSLLPASVRTLYKRKGIKVLPRNIPHEDGVKPGGEVLWKKKILEQEAIDLQHRPPDPLDKWFIPRFAREPVGTRLTPERRKQIQVGDVLRPAELELLFKILQNREMAIAWTFEEMGRVREEISPPVVIHTEKHEPWQAPSFPVPKALQKIVCEMIDERIKAGILEPCLGPYRNPWFLAKKQNGRYRLINSAIHMNRVTIKDATLPPVADGFSEEFPGLQTASYVDFMSGHRRRKVKGYVCHYDATGTVAANHLASGSHQFSSTVCQNCSQDTAGSFTSSSTAFHR